VTDPGADDDGPGLTREARPGRLGYVPARRALLVGGFVALDPMALEFVAA
jgi:hypothetical protein